MVKMLDTHESGYEPSKRSRNWLKVLMIVQNVVSLCTNPSHRSRKIIWQVSVTRLT